MSSRGRWLWRWMISNDVDLCILTKSPTFGVRMLRHCDAKRFWVQSDSRCGEFAGCRYITHSPAFGIAWIREYNAKAARRACKKVVRALLVSADCDQKEMVPAVYMKLPIHRHVALRENLRYTYFITISIIISMTVGLTQPFRRHLLLQCIIHSTRNQQDGQTFLRGFTFEH